jgi:hypothetical protein
LKVTYPYPVSAAVSYAAVYNTAYSDYMVSLGFTETSSEGFIKPKTSAATYGVLLAARQSAMNAISAAFAASVLPEYPSYKDYPGYPIGSASVDEAYANAFANYLSALGYIEPPGEFRTTPTDTAAAAAVLAGQTAAGVANFAAGNSYEKLLYAAAYAATMKASGYTLDLDYPQPLIPDFMSRPTSAQHKAASGLAGTSAGISD